MLCQYSTKFGSLAPEDSQPRLGGLRLPPHEGLLSHGSRTGSSPDGPPVWNKPSGPVRITDMLYIGMASDGFNIRLLRELGMRSVVCVDASACENQMTSTFGEHGIVFEHVALEDHPGCA